MTLLVSEKMVLEILLQSPEKKIYIEDLKNQLGVSWPILNKILSLLVEEKFVLWQEELGLISLSPDSAKLKDLFQDKKFCIEEIGDMAKAMASSKLSEVKNEEGLKFRFKKMAITKEQQRQLHIMFQDIELLLQRIETQSLKAWEEQELYVVYCGVSSLREVGMAQLQYL